MEGEGFEPSKAEPSDLQSDPFDRSGTPPNETGDYEYLETISQILITKKHANLEYYVLTTKTKNDALTSQLAQAYSGIYQRI